jgi:hypothetical protein
MLGCKMAKLLDYLNMLDQSVTARDEHDKNPMKAMADFGLCNVAQAAFLNGDKEKIARYIGIDSAALSLIIVNVDTF